jgi:hypothetical protein
LVILCLLSLQSEYPTRNYVAFYDLAIASIRSENRRVLANDS